MPSVDLYPYPTFAEFVNAGPVFAAELRKLGGANKGVLVHSGWVVIGYAGSHIMESDDGHPAVGAAVLASPRDLADAIEAAAQRPDEAGMRAALPWATILTAVLQILSELLKKA